MANRWVFSVVIGQYCRCGCGGEGREGGGHREVDAKPSTSPAARKAWRGDARDMWRSIFVINLYNFSGRKNTNLRL